MVSIKDGDEPVKVPLVYYDESGERHVVGDAAVQIKNGEVITVGSIKKSSLDVSVTNINLEAFSISAGPYQASPADEAARRLGPLSMQNRTHVTATNPDGAVSQCPRRDLHAPHEYQSKFGAYFNDYCPGNTGSER